MKVFKNWFSILLSIKIERSFNKLIKSSPDLFLSISRKKLIKTVNHVLKHSSLYKKIASDGLKSVSVKNEQEFKERIPIIDKEVLFNNNSLKELTTGISFEKIGTIRISSGSSGSYSYQVQPTEKKFVDGLITEYLLKMLFNVPVDNSVIVNTLPAGFNIPTFKVPVVITGTIEKHSYVTIKKIVHDFKHIVLTGEAPFIKKVLENGIEDGFSWKDHDVYIITGGEYVAENMRSYFSSLLGSESPEEGRVKINMGLTELATTVFFETVETIKIRRLAQSNEQFRSRFLGDNIKSIPEVMHYMPHELYMESITNTEGRPELVITLLGKKHHIPVIRYNTKDEVKLINYNELCSILIDCGLEKYQPKFKLPLGIIYGRGKRMSDGNDWFTVNEIKEVIYEDFGIANKITGAFKIFDKINDRFVVKIQLKDKVEGVEGMIDKISEIAEKYTKCRIDFALIPYNKFRYGMEFNYGRKFNYYNI
ncbi:MAG: hypothetical protein JW894_14325 [Bacteroidales bacterium]|nr:hypothetical protein [Bacteroidales bacterium]